MKAAFGARLSAGRTSKESPLVSVNEGPLIVPATLQYSGYCHRGVACEKGQPVKLSFSS